MSPSFWTVPSGVMYRCTLCESMVYEPIPTDCGVGRRLSSSFSVMTKDPIMRRASRT
jgi:hypothetical protein